MTTLNLTLNTGTGTSLSVYEPPFLYLGSVTWLASDRFIGSAIPASCRYGCKCRKDAGPCLSKDLRIFPTVDAAVRHIADFHAIDAPTWEPPPTGFAEGALKVERENRTPTASWVEPAPLPASKPKASKPRPQQAAPAPKPAPTMEEHLSGAIEDVQEMFGVKLPEGGGGGPG